MPNSCHNSMKITGTISEITRFKQTCIRTVSGNKHAQLDFRAIIPFPEPWGTTSNAQDFQVTVDTPGCYEFDFFTAFTPPVPVWEKMAEMFPALEFSMCGCEPMMEFAFEGTIQGGKLELWVGPLIYTTTDPKTGETISGPPDQIEPLLGKGGVVSRVPVRPMRSTGERQ